MAISLQMYVVIVMVTYDYEERVEFLKTRRVTQDAELNYATHKVLLDLAVQIAPKLLLSYAICPMLPNAENNFAKKRILIKIEIKIENLIERTNLNSLFC